MSSTGVRDSNSTEKRAIKGLILNETQFIQSLRVFANSSTLSGLGVTEGDSNNSPNEPSGNYLAKSGDIMLGQFGNAFDTITATSIISNTLDVSKTSGTTFPVVILQGETPPDADDLVTIIQGTDVFPFQELVIRTRSSIITIKNSDNINTPDGNDLVLPIGSIIHLYFDTFLGEWVIDGGTPFFSGGAGVNVGTIENQHLEWNNSTLQWEAKVNLEFGSIGPFADSGFIRYANDQIMLSARNPFDTGNIEVKTDSTLSRLDITDSGQGGSVGLLLRAQDSIDPDQIFSLSQGKGIGGDSIIVAPTRLIIDAGIKSFAFALDATDLTLGVDLNVNTFDIFDIDQLTFMPTVGTLNSLNVGFGALGSGGFRANVLNNGDFEITEENVLHFSFDGGSNSINVIDSLFNVLETVGGTAFAIAKFNGRTDLSDPTEINLQIAAFDIFTITSSGITMADNKFIANVDQIGFRNIGNLIEDDANGMILSVVPGDDFTLGDGTNIFASLDIDGFFLNDLYVQYQHITTPTVPGLITQGQVFFNTATNRLSFQRRNDGDTAWIVVDLEAGGGVSNEITQGDSFVRVTDAGVGSISLTVDSTEYISLGGNSVIITQNAALQGFTDIQGNVDLGNATTDTISFEGRVDTNIDPNIANTRNIGTTALNWSAMSTARTNYINAAALTGRILANADGLEIEAILAGDFVEIKTQNTNRAQFKAEADGGIIFFEPLEMNDEIMMDGGNMIHAFDSAECGFAVTDEVTSPGTEGTMQMPRTDDTTPTAAELDADFGGAIGCYGLATLGGLPSTPIFVIKAGTSPSIWRGIIMSASGNLSGVEFT